MTRPLDEVLAAVREMAQDDCIVDGDMRRELEEWEAFLAPWADSGGEGGKIAFGELAEVRQLLGRGQPETAEGYDYFKVELPSRANKDAAKPRPASPAMRALVEAAMKARDAAAALMRAIRASGYTAEVMDELESGYDGFGKQLDEAIALARAELGEEATDA